MVARVRPRFCYRRVSEQEGVFGAVPGGPGWRRRGGGGAPGGVLVGGGRRGGGFGPERRVKEGAVVGALVQIGVGLPGVRGHGERIRSSVWGELVQLVPELLHLLGQTVHWVGPVGRHRVGEGLRTERGFWFYFRVSGVRPDTLE